MSQMLDDFSCVREGVLDVESSAGASLTEGCPTVAQKREVSLEVWESDATRPAFFQISGEMKTSLDDALNTYYGRCMAAPFLQPSEIRDMQLARIRELVELAYHDIPVYRDKYRAAGFSPNDLRTYDDIQNIPPITKAELIEAFPARCLNPHYRPEDLFPTRSSGSSGQTLLIRVDAAAIVTDTIQGVRQMALQSGLKYGADDLLAHVYTVPWWFPSIGERYNTGFISNVIPPDRVAQHLREMAPQILSLYPTNLEALLPHVERFASSLYLGVTHSEYSTPSQRRAWSRRLGVPVLDEYSSEEATRIAIEFPSGSYHVCEDTVHLDVLDPVTMRPQVPGRAGVAVITNLLNEAMPFIRYVQGDHVTEPEKPARASVNWKQLESIGGRLNDAFVNRYGRTIAAGSILDITYRWMFDKGINIAQFEILQREPDLIEARFVPDAGISESKIAASMTHFEALLEICMEHPVRLQTTVTGSFPPRSGKHRPIRREFQA